MATTLSKKAAIAIGLLFYACNSSPVENLEKSFTLKVEQSSGTSDPIKIDFLWVIDNSTSMCEEQLSLTRSFDQFTSKLEDFFRIDPRVAVTSHDMQCDVNDSSIASAGGVFNTIPASKFPPACFESRVRLCATNSDCANMDCVVRGECDIDDPDCTCEGALGEWSCEGAGRTASCRINPNGTVNTQCTRACQTTEECRAVFDDDSYVCQHTTSSRSGWAGCVRPPRTAECPNEVPPVLDGTTLDYFACAATLGVNQERCFLYEQGLNAALAALDKAGSNAQQAQDFLRDDAYLVLIFISDEDDCSVAPNRTINIEDDRDTCALLPTTEVGGPLAPVGHFVNRFKSLKQDPGRVIVAAIAGDSTLESPAEVAADRSLYVESKGSPKTCYHQSYICLSGNGKADYGARYLELTESFGPNGVFTNICDDEGVGPALEAIADTIINVLNKVCLPRPVLDGLVVERTNADGSKVALTEGSGPGTYSIVEGAEDCVVDGVFMPAIAFGDPPTAGEEIIVTYEGDPQLDR